MRGPWMIGALENYVWSVVGDKDRVDISNTIMKWKNIWNLMCLLLLLGMAAVVLAEQKTLSLTLASNADGDKNTAVQINQPVKRDCNSLGYEVTLFAPCDDEYTTC